MSREVITRLVDDLDGTAAAETVRFALDGRDYEIDLSAKNAAKLRTTLSTFVESATRLSKGATAGRRGTRSVAGSRDETRAIRAWAEEQGYDVATRGRISHEIVELYRQAN